MYRSIGKCSKYCLADRSVSVPMTLSDLEGRDAKCQTFPDDLCNYAPTVLARATKFGMITLWEKGVYVLGQTHLILRGGHNVLKILGLPTEDLKYLTAAKFGMVTQGGRGVYDIPPGHVPPEHIPRTFSLPDVFPPRKPKGRTSPHTHCVSWLMLASKGY